tara:strand:+ start:607 stop:807 length:201 start_codon:yes stop_codon:yes gene_type:complete
MKIYKHIGNGHYGMGSAVICIAKTKGDALKTIREELNKMGLKDEVIRVEEDVIYNPILVHTKSGDY